MSHTPLHPNQPAQLKQLQQLHADGLLNDAAYRAAYAQLRPPQVWRHWLQQVCWMLGSALLLVGVLFFFAYNWAALPSMAKFGLLQLVILSCVSGAVYLGMKRLGGQLLITAASVLVGVLLAVFGQVYQTGADAYSLFVSWTVLISLWVVVARFAALWLIWLLLMQLAWGLYWQQLGQHLWPWQPESIALLGHLLIGSVYWGIYEFGQHRNRVQPADWLDWTQQQWLRPVLLLGLLLPVNLATSLSLLEVEQNLLVWLPLWLLGSVALHAFYYYRQPNLSALGLVISGLCLTSLVAIGKLLSVWLDEISMVLLFALVILAVATVAARWLQYLARQLRTSAHTQRGAVK